MTTTVTPQSRTVTVVGGSFQYGTYAVSVNGGTATEYPAHFVLNAGGALLNPSTEDTQLLVLAALNALLAVFKGDVVVDAGSS